MTLVCRPIDISKLEKNPVTLSMTRSNPTSWAELHKDSRFARNIRLFGSSHPIQMIDGHIFTDAYLGSPNIGSPELTKKLLTGAKKLRESKDNLPEHAPVAAVISYRPEQTNTYRLYTQGIPSFWAEALWEMNRQDAAGINFGLVVARNLVIANLIVDNSNLLVPHFVFVKNTPSHSDSIFSPTHKLFLPQDSSFGSLGINILPSTVSQRFDSEPASISRIIAISAHKRTQVETFFMHYVTPLVRTFTPDALEAKWQASKIEPKASGELEFVESSLDVLSEYLVKNINHMTSSLRISIFSYLLWNYGTDALDKLGNLLKNHNGAPKSESFD